MSATPLGVDHVFLTRFNLPSAGPESLIRAQDGWLHNRIALFERYTMPSMRAQTATGRFHWLVFLDSESPQWLLDRLRAPIEEGLFAPVFGEEFTLDEQIEAARSVSGARHPLLLTTNLDNDDAIATDFAERVQALVTSPERCALYLENGVILAGGRAYLRTDRLNAFVSVSEPWDGARGAWSAWHNRMHHHMPVRRGGGGPAWLQVIHGRNVSNRVRGHLANPYAYARAFPGLLDEASRPSTAELARDRFVTAPLREANEGLRTAGKNVLIATLGTRGFDRFKARLAGAQPARAE